MLLVLFGLSIDNSDINSLLLGLLGLFLGECFVGASSLARVAPIRSLIQTASTQIKPKVIRVEKHQKLKVSQIIIPQNQLLSFYQREKVMIHRGQKLSPTFSFFNFKVSATVSVQA